MPHDIAVHGAGLLADAVRTALESAGHRVRSTVDARQCDAVVAADDGSGTTRLATGRRVAHELGLPWYPMRVDDARVLIGPGGLPDTPGCPTCAQRRREHNRPDSAERARLTARFGTEPFERRTPLLIHATAAVAAELAIAELERLLRGAPTTVQWSLNPATAAVRTHPIMADPLCPDCSRLPADGPEALRELLAPTPKPHPTAFHTRDLTAKLPELQRLYVDSETGMIRSITDWPTGVCPAARAALEPEQAHASSHGYGRGLDVDGTKAAAVAEALERLGGQQPRGRRTVVHAAYCELADRAIDPVRFGLYADDRYDSPGFAFQRYRPDLEMPWVWAYSFARAEPVLIPESIAYYATCDRGPSFVYETSNGCALGSSLAEAALHGLLEVTERDAFLLTWYGRLAVPRVELDSAVDRRIPLLAQRVEHEFGYELAAFDCTTESGIPAYWLMAVDANRDDTRPRVLCGAAAHMVPERALLGGIQELVTIFEGFIAGYDPEAARRMVADADAVLRMDDHSTLYGHPDAFARLAFLPFDGPRQPIRRTDWPEFADLTEDLIELAGRYLAHDLDVLIVDQTSAEHRAGGFACAKAFVPGTLPMTFGHRNRRDHGLPRIRTMPRILGYADRDLSADEINPYPHPFP